MATILKNVEDLQEHLSIGFKFSWQIIKPFVVQSERQYIKTLLGAELYKDWTTTAPTEAAPIEVYNLCKEAATNLATLKYIPTGSVNISDAGILTNQSERTKQAEWWQIKDLKRSLLENAFSAIDEALKIMEDNESKFTKWIDTESYTVFKELHTPKTQDFQRWFNINNSRRTFLALNPFILETQQKIFNWIPAATLTQIKAASNTTEKQALDLLQAAQVAHTIATAVATGIFETTATGITLKFAELPGEKIYPVQEQRKHALMQERQNAGDQYLKLLKTHLENNVDVFQDYTTTTTEATVFVHNTKSIVTF